jgi:hypothetical protein
MGGKAAKCSEDEFIRMFEEHGPMEVARRLGTDKSTVFKRRRNLELKYKRPINPPDERQKEKRFEEHPARIHKAVKDGVVLVGSDFHYWPGIISTAHRAFVHFCKKLKPVGVAANGDVMDGATISRHPPIGWEHRPSLIQEIETCQDRLHEIMSASGAAWHTWELGNHCARYATRLATVAPEFAKVHGTQLKDHFAGWQPCWSLWINDDVVVKHRFKGGMHAPHNNTLWSGKTIVTGHLHSQKVMPISDYSGTRWGVDTGTMAEPYGPQFVNYTEDNAVSWRSGFAVLTFKNGRLADPELVRVTGEGEVCFRGEFLKV